MTPVASPTAAPAGTTPERASLHKAAQAFEAIFVREMLTAARSTNFGDTLWGDDQGGDTFTAMRDERFADIASQSGALGLARQVETQLAARLAPPAVVAPGSKG
jgi:flagellar protein FlgJ